MHSTALAPLPKVGFFSVLLAARRYWREMKAIHGWV